MSSPRFLVLSTLLATSSLLLGSTTAMADSPTVDICHYVVGMDGAIIIQVAPEAVSAHVELHGDSVTADYWTDADGDGFGDSGGSYTMCPGPGRVDNADDCDDSDPSVYPGAEEVCGDGIDNNCLGGIDDGCESPSDCSCYSYEDIDAAYATFQLLRADYDVSYPVCSIYEDWGPYDRDIGNLYFTMRNNYDTSFELDLLQFYTTGYDTFYESNYCDYRDYHAERNMETGELVIVYNEHIRHSISLDERESCQSLIEEWSDDHGLYCRLTTDP